MSFEKAEKYVAGKGYSDRIKVFGVSSATVELAAKAVGTEPGKIAKSLTFKVDDKPVMILFAGDSKVDNAKYKKQFHTKAKMLTPDEVEGLVGHTVGGVCPFGINEGVKVYLDESLRKYDIVYPACGSGNSAVELTIAELEEIIPGASWIDVGKSSEFLKH